MNNKSTGRYERKFVIPYTSLEECKFFLLENDSRLKRLYNNRDINNVYLDSFNYNSFNQNIDGIAIRDKIRIRWYGDTYGLIEPNLEIKSKRAHVGFKTVKSINPFILNRNMSGDEFKNQIFISKATKLIGFDYKFFQTTLMNSYKRSYYISQDKSIRVTVDSNISFFRFQPFSKIHSKSSKLFSYCIVELKYEKENDYLAQCIANQFPVRLSKISKYTLGMKLIYGD